MCGTACQNCRIEHSTCNPDHLLAGSEEKGKNTGPMVRAQVLNYQQVADASVPPDESVPFQSYFGPGFA